MRLFLQVLQTTTKRRIRVGFVIPPRISSGGKRAVVALLASKALGTMVPTAKDQQNGARPGATKADTQPPSLDQSDDPKSNYAVAAVLRDWKHSLQNTGRPWVGRKGTVVSLPHPEQVACVSTLVKR